MIKTHLNIDYTRIAKRTAIAVIVISMVAGCRPFWVMTVDPQGPPEYRLGWQDGCDSGMSAEGEWSAKLMFGFKKRPELSANDQYKQGWNEGFTYCRFAYSSSKSPGNWGAVGLGDGF